MNTDFGQPENDQCLPADVQKKSQERILHRERLTAVGQLAAGLAHEFNNIMTIVQGHAALLKENPNLDEESVKSLTHITEGADRMAKLIRQMLAFSSKQVMQPKALDVPEILGHTSEMLGRLLGGQVALNFEIAPHLPPILADPDMFQQIIVNLVVNARDAMSSGGQLTIRATESIFAPTDIPSKSDRKPGQFVRLSVTDTGSGMDTAIISHLFEPFFTTKDVGKGTGWGLATVHGMVNQHQGWIEVESKLGRGTTFDIYFPAADKPLEKQAEPADFPDIRGGQETVLVVEDESVLRELVFEILSLQGYGVLEAANGLDALHVWDQNRKKVDLLLTDIALPHGPNGRELAGQFRKENPRLPVIFSSGYAQEMVEGSEDSSQRTFYLSKPYNPAQLAQAVRHALDESRKSESTTATPVC
jgi:two-component system cell cycle sensor histidine kinase/response regulator CckA